MISIDTVTYAEGCLVGLACGDALGRPLEFRTASQIEAEDGCVTELIGHGAHSQPAGTVSDNTDMALCIALSLAEEGSSMVTMLLLASPTGSRQSRLTSE